MKNNVLKVLKAGRKLIAKKHNWIKGYYALDRHGKSVPADSKNAVCFCSAGAMNHTIYDLFYDYPADELREMYMTVRHSLASAMDGNVTVFNDAHTHREVLAAWDKAIETQQNVSQ